jgi:hypothetical protein
MSLGNLATASHWSGSHALGFFDVRERTVRTAWIPTTVPLLLAFFVVCSLESQYRASHRASRGAPSRGSRALLVIRRLDLEGVSRRRRRSVDVVEVDLEHGKRTPLHTHPIFESLWITQPITTATAAKSEVSSTYRNDCRPGTGTPSPHWKAATGTRWSSMNRNCTWTSTGVVTRRLLRGHRRTFNATLCIAADKGKHWSG